MAITTGIFSDETNFEDRYIPNHKKLAKLVSHWKGMGLRVVLTSGTWDLFHVGHAQYLEKAKKLGDILVVGVDSDKKVKARKGPHRPVVPEDERVRTLSHVRHVDVITLKRHSDSGNNLIKAIHPDVLVVSKSSGHSKSDLRGKRKYCQEIAMLDPQAATSTSAKVRLLHVSGADQLAKELVPYMQALLGKGLVENTKALEKRLAEQIPEAVEDTLERIRSKKR